MMNYQYDTINSQQNNVARQLRQIIQVHYRTGDILMPY